MKKEYKQGVAPVVVVVGVLIVLAVLYFLFPKNNTSTTGGPVLYKDVSTSPDSLLGVWELRAAQLYDTDKKQWINFDIKERGLSLVSHRRFAKDGGYCEGSVVSGKFVCDDSGSDTYKVIGDKINISQYEGFIETKWGIQNGNLELDLGVKGQDGVVRPWTRVTMFKLQ
ncbi:MAG: hypothetical protein HZA94_02210 [Candidatus Vogelbacteria bacterium]|nr:hypothetical protein [Candidatus Vogelbacteria bacterium]